MVKGFLRPCVGSHWGRHFLLTGNESYLASRRPMTFSARLLSLCALLLVCAVRSRAEPSAPEAPKSLPEQPAAQAYGFSCTMNKPGPTSAGIYDSQGKLIRTLWTMKGTAAGPLRARWNGRDSEENPPCR
jgi:hypothetical protein